MADFKIAYLPTAKVEGGYSNDKDDTGGETVFGLTRRDWPNWDGWKIVDHLKAQPNGISLINNSQELKSSVETLFKANYWNPIKLDSVNDQQIANQVFDTAINMGVTTAALMLQRAANVPDDGVVGSKTLSAVNGSIAVYVYNKFIELRKARYEAIIAKNPSQEKFRKSWFSRLTPYK